MTDPRDGADEVPPDSRVELEVPSGSQPRTGRLGSVAARASLARAEATRRADDLRARNALVEAAFDAAEMDRRRAGSLLAGGIAFRLFLWLLPAALFVAAVVGLVRPTGGASPDRVAKSLGLGASVASSIAQATQHSDRGAVTLIVIGLVLMLYASMSLVRALRIAHVLAWEEPFERRPGLLRDGAIVSVGIIATIALETAFTYVRRQDPALSLLLIPLSFVLVGGAWLGLSSLLPHGHADWRALLPGAVVIAVGHAVLQVATTFYFAPKLTTAPALYGSLGTAATLLLWLFVVARLIVATAFLNASRWRR